MEDVRDRYIKGLNIALNIEMLSQGMVHDIIGLIDKFPGEMPLQITIHHQAKKYQFDMYSTNKKINLCPDLLNELERAELAYQIQLK